jgi:hypothetical protein
METKNIPSNIMEKFKNEQKEIEIFINSGEECPFDCSYFRCIKPNCKAYAWCCTGNICEIHRYLETKKNLKI